MKNFLIPLFFILFMPTLQAQTIPEGLQQCNGAYALCAASTCTPTGNLITLDGKNYEEAVCSCPVLTGAALADVDGGNMQGSCDRIDNRQVWSLFSYKRQLPQEMFDWSSKRTKVQECPSDLKLANQSVNCFSMSCEITAYEEGTAIASCACPIGQSVANTKLKPATAFLIQSGQGDSSYCGKHPVAVTPFMQKLKK